MKNIILTLILMIPAVASSNTNLYNLGEELLECAVYHWNFSTVVEDQAKTMSTQDESDALNLALLNLDQAIVFLKLSNVIFGEFGVTTPKEFKSLRASAFLKVDQLNFIQAIEKYSYRCETLSVQSSFNEEVIKAIDLDHTDHSK